MGTIVVVESWLVGVGFVVFGGALVGRLLCERFGYTEEPPEDESGTGQGPSTVPSSRGTV
jgi:membrane protein